MKIAIRADGGSEIGMGHIMRTLVLAQKLRKTSEVFYICRTDNPLSDKYKCGIDKIKEEGFKVICIDENNIIDGLRKIDADCLITDSYDVDDNYFIQTKSLFKKTGYIDDINKVKMKVDFIINQNFRAEYINYSRNANKNTKLFLGSKYCMIRDEFKKEEIHNKNGVDNVLLTVGGMDKEYNTLKILKRIKEIGKCIHVVVGSAFDEDLKIHLRELSNVYSNIKLHENAIMSELMNLCDIAISACGSTLYELCAMNVPTIGVIIADNQEKIAKNMSEKQAIIGGIWLNDCNIDKIYELLNILLTKKEVRVNIINNQLNVVNTNGAQLLSDEIIKLIKNN